MDTIHNTKGCFYRALDDEPIFVLLARDPAAADTIRHWVTLRHAMIGRGEKALEDHAKLDEATETAGAMVAWRYEAADPTKYRPERWKQETVCPRVLVSTPAERQMAYDDWLVFKKAAMPLGNRFLLGLDTDGEYLIYENHGTPESPIWEGATVLPTGLQGMALRAAYDDWRNMQHEKAETIKNLLSDGEPKVEHTADAVKNAFLLTKETPGVLLEDVKNVIRRHECENLHELLNRPETFDSVMLDLDTLREHAARRQPAEPEYDAQSMPALLDRAAKVCPDEFKAAVQRHYPGFIASNVAPAVANRLRKAKQRLDGEIGDSTWPRARKDRMRAISATIQNEIEVLEAAEETSRQYRGKPAPRGSYWFDEIDARSTFAPSDKPRWDVCDSLDSPFMSDKHKADFSARLREVMQDTEFWKKELCVPFDEMSDRYRKLREPRPNGIPDSPTSIPQYMGEFCGHGLWVAPDMPTVTRERLAAVLAGGQKLFNPAGPDKRGHGMEA